jgi:hypothetical protein
VTDRANKFEDLTVKTCTGCGIELPLDAFYRKSPNSAEGQRFRTEYGRAMQPCKECRKARSRELKERPERKRQIRSWNLQSHYGISLDDYEALLAKQGGVCAICAKPPSSNGPRQKYLHVDHDHSDGRVRGLLCANCNIGIGNLQDDPALLRKGAEYLEG